MIFRVYEKMDTGLASLTYPASQTEVLHRELNLKTGDEISYHAEVDLPNRWRETADSEAIDEVESLVEAALETLPNVANAEVTIIVDGYRIRPSDPSDPPFDLWRIELTEGPGGIVSMRHTAVGPSHHQSTGPTYFLHPHWASNPETELQYYFFPTPDTGAVTNIDTNPAPDQEMTTLERHIKMANEQPTALFTFDGATSDALTPSARAAFDLALAEGDGEAEGATADPADAWRMGLGAFDGDLQFDYIGA